MRKFLVAASVAASGLLMAAQAEAAGFDGTVDFSFNRFTGPFAATDPANLADPSQWFLQGTVNGLTPTVTGTSPTSFHFPTEVMIDGTMPLSGNRVDMVYANVPGALDNIIEFDPVPFTNVLPHQPFMLGTLTFTNGQWVGGDPNRAFNVPDILDFTIQTHSANPAFNQTLQDSITFTTNNAPNDIDCATNPQTQQSEADFVFFSGGSGLGAMRVYDQFCKPAGVSNTGTVQLWMSFSSLDYDSLRNPTGGAFLTNGVGTGPVGGAMPEPAEWALLLGGFGLAGAALRARRSARRAVPVHA